MSEMTIEEKYRLAYGAIAELKTMFCGNCPYATTTAEGKFRCKKCTGCRMQMIPNTIEILNGE